MSRLGTPLLRCLRLPSASPTENTKSLPCSRPFAVAASRMACATTEVRCHCSRMSMLTQCTRSLQHPTRGCLAPPANPTAKSWSAGKDLGCTARAVVADVGRYALGKQPRVLVHHAYLCAVPATWHGSPRLSAQPILLLAWLVPALSRCSHLGVWLDTSRTSALIRLQARVQQGARLMAVHARLS